MLFSCRETVPGTANGVQKERKAVTAPCGPLDCPLMSDRLVTDFAAITSSQTWHSWKLSHYIFVRIFFTNMTYLEIIPWYSCTCIVYKHDKSWNYPTIFLYVYFLQTWHILKSSHDIRVPEFFTKHDITWNIPHDILVRVFFAKHDITWNIPTIFV